MDEDSNGKKKRRPQTHHAPSRPDLLAGVAKKTSSASLDLTPSHHLTDSGSRLPSFAESGSDELQAGCAPAFPALLDADLRLDTSTMSVPDESDDDGGGAAAEDGSTYDDEGEEGEEGEEQDGNYDDDGGDDDDDDNDDDSRRGRRDEDGESNASHSCTRKAGAVDRNGEGGGDDEDAAAAGGRREVGGWG